MNVARLKGIFLPVVTPFDQNGHLDLLSFEHYIQRVIDNGVQGLVINGTTGESATVKYDELQALVNTAKKVINKRDIPIVVGASSNDTTTTVEKIEAAGILGADAVLVVSPYYVLPSKEGLIEHFRVAASVGVPVIIYDNPRRTGIAMDVDTICTIMELENVLGLKDSSGDIRVVTELTRRDSKPVLCGDDMLLYASLCCGATGGIVASASIQTEQFVKMFQYFSSGKVMKSRETFLQLVPLIKALFKEASPAPIKWLLADKGSIASEYVRLPLMGISDDLKHELNNLLHEER